MAVVSPLAQTFKLRVKRSMVLNRKPAPALRADHP